jgi:hypothetical protein
LFIVLRGGWFVLQLEVPRPEWLYALIAVAIVLGGAGAGLGLRYLATDPDPRAGFRLKMWLPLTTEEG